MDIVGSDVLDGGSKPSGAHKVGVAAIAKDEGAYIADWVHHNLFFGFNCINVWVNGTSDETIAILRRISALFPQVEWEEADGLMARSMSGAGMFQHLAYAGLRDWGERTGCSHLLFVDIDEMWTPRDFRSPISTFVERTPGADIISFPWFLDEPNVNRVAFSSIFEMQQELAPNHHVKSLVRLSERLRKVTTHSATLEGGTRLLVDREFEMLDPEAQAHGSKLSPAQFRSVADEIPAAFIMHWIYRSQLEYVAILGKGTAQAGSRYPIKKNRDGYLLRTARRTEFRIEPAALANYRVSRQQFLERCGIADLVERAQGRVVAEAARVSEYIATATELEDFVHRAMTGVDQALLDQAVQSKR